MKKPATDVLFQEESTYKDMLLRKSVKMRVMETVAFVLGMLILAQILPSNNTAFKVLAFAIAIAVVGLAPFLYRSMLRPVYKLTKTHLIITMSGKETSYPLSEVEQIYEGRHLYRVGGKRESLMVSREFLKHLNERLFYYNKANKRR
ncbi:hypothetical protein [Brevibacillus centrosporus]|uniref:YcxB-like protein n=1 Tax=Brevibacillus centrosporus TaxID=54910 RepID=A0A1I3Y0N0_9BACL|nr:hypothetical protein [Brevibacillus centrosporus]MEC2128682.1 hypothetical protein [Brevibacillus centrosporus]MED4910321.1 hypothetical protein [Brevibacillus centrosporus]RNB71449.1 hypothetical protein EDM55_08950 [Brevibacillus centrosporus]SFK25388.1 hypothetical protein SAMN05518846_110175 [Brevibacillus centrosporus]GED30430.1 hypothetical protein BCE02nite_15710 [Brevibacillus centrosporus]